VTNQHPITPPRELVDQLLDGNGTYVDDMRQAAQWGADQELEACIEWVSIQLNCTSQEHLVPHLRAARRPKPPSLKEQAFKDLDELLRIARQAGVFNPPDNIRRALEALPE
jgi:hypothetical protein